LADTAGPTLGYVLAMVDGHEFVVNRPALATIQELRRVGIQVQFPRCWSLGLAARRICRPLRLAIHTTLTP